MVLCQQQIKLTFSFSFTKSWFNRNGGLLLDLIFHKCPGYIMMSTAMEPSTDSDLARWLKLAFTLFMSPLIEMYL